MTTNPAKKGFAAVSLFFTSFQIRLLRSLHIDTKRMSIEKSTSEIDKGQSQNNPVEISKDSDSPKKKGFLKRIFEKLTNKKPFDDVNKENKLVDQSVKKSQKQLDDDFDKWPEWQSRLIKGIFITMGLAVVAGLITLFWFFNPLTLFCLAFHLVIYMPIVCYLVLS